MTVENLNTSSVGGEASSNDPNAGEALAATQEGGDAQGGSTLEDQIATLSKHAQDSAADAAYWRGVAESNAQKKPEPPNTKPELNPDDFSSDADYLRAVTKQTREELKAEIRAESDRGKKEEQSRTIMAQYDQGRQEHPDFDSVALAPTVPVTQTMFDAAMGDKLYSVLYYLGKNTKEAARISSLSPTMQIKEIGRVEALLSSTTSSRQTNAPNPPVKLGGPAPSSYKKEADMTRAELHSKWEAGRRAKAGI